jgi:hypothetical protein
MAKKKSGVARVVKSSRRKRSPRRNPAAVAAVAPPLLANPPLMVDLTNYVLPGFAGYAAARVASRLAYKAMRGRGTGWAQAASPIAGAAIAGGIFAYSHYMKPELSQSPIAHSAMVGASIAAIQNTVQAIMPQLGWLVGDCYHDDVLVPQGAKLVPANAQVAAPRQNGVGDDDIDIAALLDNSDLMNGNGGGDMDDLVGGQYDDEFDDLKAGIFG